MGSHTSQDRQGAVPRGRVATTTSAADLDDQIRLLARPVVYNDMRAFAVGNGSPTEKTCRIADALFFEKIVTAEGFGRYKLAEKKAYFCELIYAALLAIYHDGCIQHSLKPGRHGCTTAKLQVLKAAVAADLFHEIRSPPGSPKMSRYIPLSALRQHASLDPLEFDAGQQSPRYVFLCRRKVKEERRKVKEEIAFDPEHPTAKDVQRRLELVNEVNGRQKITHVQRDEWHLNCSERERTRQLRPVHYAKFTDDFEHHGRLYTGRYGHQSLCKSGRETIRFGWEASVEVDFRGMHALMLYHLKGIAYRPDPYALWGKATTVPQRLMAKTLINAAINAASKVKAISACNFKTSLYTGEKNKKGKMVRKRSKKLEKALTLRRAADETGLTFSQIYPLILERHDGIKHYFGIDMGIKLMRHDSAIALDILHYFALRGIPCLAVHDSFIVPKRYETDLRRAMLRYYKRRLGFLPVLSK